MFLVFLRRPDVHRIAKGRWHFTSFFGATKNGLPLKEAPNGLGKCMRLINELKLNVTFSAPFAILFGLKNH
jgi:hypothetical protein